MVECSIPVGGINGLTTYTKYQITATIKSTSGKYQKSLTFLTVPNITESVPSESIPRELFQIPHNLKLADPTFYQPGSVDMLLGSGPTLALFCVGQYNLPPDLYLQKTQLGWIVGGSTSNRLNTTSVCNNETLKNFFLNTDCDLEKFWRLEEVPRHRHHSLEESEAEKHFLKNFARDATGRPIVALPFKQNKEKLGKSKDLALKRLKGLEKKLQQQPGLKELYDAGLQEYLDLGHMTEVNEDEQEENGVYLAHFAVFKDTSLTTKIRIVFDASAPTSTGVALNEVLMTGPTVQDDLFSHLIHYRFQPIVLTGDIEKMYRQILVRPADRIYQRILWRDKSNRIRTYQLNTVTFGFTSAAFSAIAAVQQLAKINSAKYPIAARILLKRMYVDDLLEGFNSVAEAKEALRQIIECLHEGGMNIRQWASNKMELLQHLPAESINQRLQLGDQTLKTLGVFWNAQSDTISYNAKPIITGSTVTKRIILSHVASLFDPLGLLGPVILLAKNIIQQLWSNNIEWDESVPTSIHTLWTDFCNELPIINDIHFDRYVLVLDPISIQLHGFCDASERGYGACFYLRSVNREGHIKSALLCSKSRVAPLKTISIPRLELCGALILTRLYQSLREKLEIPISRTVLWTDSMIALHWIHSSPHLLKTFVGNRVCIIQQEASKAEWRHVKSEDNPADALSRGQLPREFSENILWAQGPTWLSQSESTWNWETIPKPLDDKEKKVATCLHTVSKLDVFKHYSSWTKLKRHVALWRRFFQYLKNKECQGSSLTIDEIAQAQRAILLNVQHQEFHKDICILQSPRRNDYNGGLQPLSPFIDDQGLLRVGGRLSRAQIPQSQKQQILLPKDHHVTKIIIREEHQRQLHGGIQTTLYSLRQQFWLINGRSQVRKILRQCLRCLRARPPIPDHIMGDLPEIRVTAAPFFQHVGVDYCGPFHVKETIHQNRRKIKVYVAVFVCLVVKAVHLELVSDLTTEGFLGALRRFVSRRGKPAVIQSDNGTNFVGANNELERIVEELKSQNSEISAKLTEKGIRWSFSPPLAPHFGGIWEAAVKSFKHHLRRVVNDQLLSLEQFITLTVEIEAILNSRPISPMSTDPNDLASLTPGDILIGRPLTALPEVDLLDFKSNRLSQ